MASMTTPATTPADGELLACPFCDDPDGECAESAVPNKFAVYCNGCFCEGPTADTKDAAIAAWNRRAVPSPGKAPEPVAWYIADDYGKPFKAVCYQLERDKLETKGYKLLPLYASPGKAEAEDAAQKQRVE